MSASGDGAPVAGARAPDAWAAAAFAGCALIWSSTFLAIRIGNSALPPLWAASIRLALAAVVLTLLARVTNTLPRTAAAAATAAQFGFLNFGVGLSLLYWGETRVPSGISAAIYGTVPLSTALFARMLGVERLTPTKVLAAAIAVLGVAVIFSSRLVRDFTVLGLLAVVGSSTCGALSGVVLKRGPRQHTLGINAVGCWAGLAVCLAGTFLFGEPHPRPTPGTGLYTILYLTVTGSIGAYVLFAWLVQQWPVTRVSFIGVIVPVLATMLGVLVGNERVTAPGLLGAALVLMGLSLSIWSDRRPGPPQ